MYSVPMPSVPSETVNAIQWMTNDLTLYRGCMLVVVILFMLSCIAMAWAYVPPIETPEGGQTAVPPGRVLTVLGVVGLLLLFASIVFLAAQNDAVRTVYMTVVISILLLWALAWLGVLTYVLQTRPVAQEEVRYIAMGVSGGLLIVCFGMFWLFLSPRMRAKLRF